MGITQSKQRKKIVYEDKTISGTRGTTEKNLNKSKFWKEPETKTQYRQKTQYMEEESNYRKSQSLHRNHGNEKDVL